MASKLKDASKGCERWAREFDALSAPLNDDTINKWQAKIEKWELDPTKQNDLYQELVQGMDIHQIIQFRLLFTF